MDSKYTMYAECVHKCPPTTFIKPAFIERGARKVTCWLSTDMVVVSVNGQCGVVEVGLSTRVVEVGLSTWVVEVGLSTRVVEIGGRRGWLKWCRRVPSTQAVEVASSMVASSMCMVEVGGQ